MPIPAVITATTTTPRIPGHRGRSRRQPVWAGRGQVHGAGELHATDQERGEAQEDAVEPLEVCVRPHKGPDQQQPTDGQAEVSGGEGDSAVHRSSWSAGAAGCV
jgi:hypothetical protein